VAVNADREIDKTCLSANQADERGIIHRDLIAHAFRWSHVIKFLSSSKYKHKVNVLDIGCGREVPLARSLYSNRFAPTQYVGIDAGPLKVPEMLDRESVKWLKLVGNVDVSNYESLCAVVSDMDERVPLVIVCFEMLEHVSPQKCRAVLNNLWLFAMEYAKSVTFFFSTPCWNGSAAENHINEMTFEAFGTLLEDLQYNIDAMYGTFASQADYKDLMSQELRNAYERLSEYYESNVLSIIFAPLFPHRSRNCLWQCSVIKDKTKPPFSRGWESIKAPWSQHKDWEALRGSHS